MAISIWVWILIAVVVIVLIVVIVMVTRKQSAVANRERAAELRERAGNNDQLIDSRRDRADELDHAYSREQAAFPLPYLRQHKFWPSIGRIDNVHGDRNLICTCDSVEAYAERGA